MQRLGLIGTVQLAATLVFALPVALLGAGFVAVGALMVALEEYLTTPSDVPGSLAQKTVGRVMKTPEDEE